MKKSRLIYLSLGFLAGVAYLIACGGGSSKVEEAIGQATASVIAALNVTYDNVTSKLQATNVQAAIDELAARPTVGNSILASQLVGTWKGTQYAHSSVQVQQNVVLTLNSDGSVSCSNPSNTAPTTYSINNACRMCLTPSDYKWALKGSVVEVEGISNQEPYPQIYIFMVNYVDDTNIQLYSFQGESFFYGTKQ